MEQPLVSIIIPVYNTATHLARCIESVRKQTYENLEIFLVNDGSSDTSGSICDMYARVDSRMRVIEKVNSGVSDTRNAAIDLAAGKYLQFADSDDYLAPDATALLVARAEATQSDLVIAHYCRVENDGMENEAHATYGFLSRTDVLDQTEFARELMDEPASFYYGVLWNKLYRASIIHAQKIRCNEDLQWSEDFLFNLEFIRYAQRFTALAQPIYYYVKNEKGLAHTQGNLKNILRVKTMLFGYYKDLYTRLGLYEKYRPQIYRYLIAMAEHN